MYKQGKRFATSVMLVVMATLAVLLAACGSNPGSTTGSSKAPDDKQVFVYPVAGTPDLSDMDPAFAGGPIGPTLIYTGLVQLNEKQQLIDQLAQSHSVSADGLTWTFKLRPNLKFSDGSPLTSQDIVYSINRALEPALKSPYAMVYLGLIKDADKLQTGAVKTLVDDSLLAPTPDTVKIITKQKAAYFLQTMTYVTSYPVNKKLVDKYGKSFVDHLGEGAGAGPFIMSKYDQGRQMTFTPNPYYYGPKPALKKVIMAYYKDSETIYKVYETNQVSYAKIPTAKLASARNLPNNQFHLVPILGVQYYAMNYLAKPFNNIKIRQAFDLAINKDQIANKVLRGSAIPTNNIVPSGMPGHNPDLTGPAGVTSTKGDQAKAKQLFAEGLKEENLTLSSLPPITLSIYATSQDDTNQAVAVQQMWQEVLGVQVKIDTVDVNKLSSELDSTTNNPNGLQMWSSYWKADYPDPQNWLTTLFAPESSFDNYNYGNNHAKDIVDQKKALDLMRQADGEMDITTRLKLYNQAEQQVVNDAGWIPLYQMETGKALKPCVKGYDINAPFMPAPDSWSNIYISNDKPCTNV
ncbi:ABC transporter substrate-binding protein [Ktedonobacter sp. SOSP1-52]|uniref:peptide ABC transporter substrate-binding protein n=1 Tax=Ktedonobacter sp. SOSP1-52 TaxID=2778366 RepID=UPI00191529BC|nr:peptide ABC transporter substrate-binding protein [Ktedonobacter sp. SOSP1-52]GHO70697.1 ABC transporter substrate-binding protein [Ktedonobacter sp. SOSP1-52]